MLYYRPSPETVTESGMRVKAEDRSVRLRLLRALRDITVEKARLCGFYSPKALERVSIPENQNRIRVQIERPTFEDSWG